MILIQHVIIQWLANCWLHVYSWYIYMIRYPRFGFGWQHDQRQDCNLKFDPRYSIRTQDNVISIMHWQTRWPHSKKNMFCLPSSFGRGDSWFRIALKFFMTSGRAINYWMVFLLNIDIPIIPIPIAILYIYILYIDYIYTIYIYIYQVLNGLAHSNSPRPRADLRRHEFFRDMNFAAGYRRGFVGTQ